MEIKFVKHEDIDQLRWNSCVHYAGNGHVYGYKWYLDNVVGEWDGLVEGEYESVWPLIWRPLPGGAKELFLPELVGSAGIYSVHVLSRARVEAFWKNLPEEYRLRQLRFAPGTRPPEVDLPVQSLENHRLYLQGSYEEIESRYSDQLREKLLKAEDLSLRPLSKTAKPEDLADFFKKYSPRKRSRNQTFHALQRIMYNALHRGIGFVSGVEDADGQRLAMNFFIFSHGKIMSLMPVVNAAGRRKHALAYLFDLMIRTNAGRPLMMDFNFLEKGDLAKDFGAQHILQYQLERRPSLWSRWWSAGG